jgi:hypothetical protein
MHKHHRTMIVHNVGRLSIVRWLSFSVPSGDAAPKWPPVTPDKAVITADDIVKKSMELDPVQIFSLDMGGGLDSTGKMTELALATEGAVIRSDVGGLVEKIIEVIELAGSQPFAWIGEGYVGKVGSPVVFDASGSRSQDNATLQKYEWDFDGDGVYDKTTTVPNATKTYGGNFSGYVKMRVTTSSNLSSVASALVLINEEGTVPQLGPGGSPFSTGPVYVWLPVNVTEEVSKIRGAVDSVRPSLLDVPMAKVELHEGGFHGGLDQLRSLAASQLPPGSLRRDLKAKADNKKTTKAKSKKTTKTPRPTPSPTTPPLNSETLKDIINKVDNLEVALGYKE